MLTLLLLRNILTVEMFVYFSSFMFSFLINLQINSFTLDDYNNTLNGKLDNYNRNWVTKLWYERDIWELNSLLSPN
jgi:hypothetical protein